MTTNISLDLSKALSALRVLESCLWKTWGQSCSPLLMLCLDLKILLTGNSPDRTIRQAFFLVWQGHLKEAKILADQAASEATTHEEQKNLEKLREILDISPPIEEMKAIKDWNEIIEIREALVHLEKELQSLGLSYAHQIFKRIESFLSNILGSTCKSEDLSCPRHPREQMSTRRIEFPYLAKKLGMRKILACPICDRRKTVSQDEKGTWELLSESEWKYYLRNFCIRYIRFGRLSYWLLRLVIPNLKLPKNLS
ncbi:MAG: hypothetical protein HUU50_11455 [Candidatus Brocadiae bacterium]|nr:hypothetical protein [Candidatus Brocadiia bacterium]